MAHTSTLRSATLARTAAWATKPWLPLLISDSPAVTTNYCLHCRQSRQHDPDSIFTDMALSDELAHNAAQTADQRTESAENGEHGQERAHLHHRDRDPHARVAALLEQHDLLRFMTYAIKKHVVHDHEGEHRHTETDERNKTASGQRGSQAAVRPTPTGTPDHAQHDPHTPDLTPF